MLVDANPDVHLPAPVNSADTTPQTRLTPETYLAAGKSANYGGDGEYKAGTAGFGFPTQLAPDKFALTGRWTLDDQGVTADSDGAAIRLNYSAKDVFAVVGGTGTITVNRDGNTTTVPISGPPTLRQIVADPAARRDQLDPAGQQRPAGVFVHLRLDISKRAAAHPPGRWLRIRVVDPSDARSVAVIGSGVAGLTAAYVLSGRDRVTLYEADVRLGGHAHTHFVDDDGQTLGVDSAFLVHNDRTYPTLCRLLRELGVATQESEMSMSVRADDIGLEYAGALGVRGLFACRQSLRPRYLLMLGEIVRFHRAADRLLHAAGAQDDLETLDAFLRRHHFSSYFIDYFITPLVAAVWSCAADNALRYPRRYLFTFLAHHGSCRCSVPRHGAP